MFFIIIYIEIYRNTSCHNILYTDTRRFFDLTENQMLFYKKIAVEIETN